MTPSMLVVKVYGQGILIRRARDRANLDTNVANKFLATFSCLSKYEKGSNKHFMFLSICHVTMLKTFLRASR